MRSFLKTIAIVALTAALAACDRAPTDLSPREVEALLAASGLSASDTRSFNSVLPALLRQSIVMVEKAKGRDGVEDLLSDWRKLQEELKAEAATARRAAIEAKLAQIHAEELRIVHSVLGNAVITRLVSETNVGLATATLSIDAAAAAGRDVTRALAIAQQVRAELAATTNAVTLQAGPEALDHAADAAGTLASLRHHLLELQRIEGLETLYPKAVARVRRERGTAAADALVAKLGTLNARTHSALRSGDRADAHESLALARAEQIHIVQGVLGSDAARRLVYDVDMRAQEIAALLATHDRSGRDVVKYQRMLREAVDLKRRAASALRKGDHATALDLGSHAAGLLNTLQHLTWQ